MKLAELKAAGGFVSGEPVKTPVRWERGEEVIEFSVHVRRLSFGEYERLYIDPKDKERSRTAGLIAASILLGEKGDEPMTYKDAFQLDTSLAQALIAAIREVSRPKA
jgi:hypothetical protein